MGSPMSPLGQVTNPLSSVIDGMLQGHQLGLQMRQQQMQEQAFQTNQALQNQKIQAGDEQGRQELIHNSRQVDSQGRVFVGQDDPRWNQALDQQPAGTPPARPPYTAPGMAAPGGNLIPNNVGIQEPAEPVEEGGLNAQGSTPREAAENAAKNAGGMWVPADKTRLTKFKDSQGNVMTGERYTEQQLAQRALAADVAKMTAERDIPFAKDKPDIAKTMLENEQIQDPAYPNDPKKTIRRGDLPKAREDVETNRAHLAEEGNVEAGQVSNAKTAEDNRIAADARNKTTTDAANSRATERNRTVLAAAGIRKAGTGADGKPLTPNAAGVQGRFDQREIDADTKIADKAQADEQKAHASRLELGDASAVQDGEEFTDPITGKDVTMNPIRRSRIKAQYNQQTALVKQLQTTQATVREKHQWGEFAPGAAPAAAAPAAGAAPAAAPAKAAAAPKYTDRQIMTNPTTKARVQYSTKDNKWTPIK